MDTVLISQEFFQSKENLPKNKKRFMKWFYRPRRRLLEILSKELVGGKCIS
jgi:hypothetical protein